MQSIAESEQVHARSQTTPPLKLWHLVSGNSIDNPALRIARADLKHWIEPFRLRYLHRQLESGGVVGTANALDSELWGEWQ